jgi:hypothetical protein
MSNERRKLAAPCGLYCGSCSELLLDETCHGWDGLEGIAEKWKSGSKKGTIHNYVIFCHEPGV